MNTSIDPNAGNAASTSANTADFISCLPADYVPFDFVTAMNQMVENMQKFFVDPQTKATQKYSEYLKDISNLEILIAQSTKVDKDDAEKVNIDFDAIAKQIGDLKNKYSPTNPDGSFNPTSALYISNLTGADGLAQAQQWATQMGVDPNSIVRCGSGEDTTYAVVINIQTLTDIGTTYNGYPSNKVSVVDNTTINQGKDAATIIAKNKMQEMAQTLSQTVATMGNISNSDSSQQSKIYESCRGFMPA